MYCIRRKKIIILRAKIGNKIFEAICFRQLFMKIFKSLISIENRYLKIIDTSVLKHLRS